MKSNLKRANAARIIFYLLVAISIISFYSYYLQYELLLSWKEGAGIQPEAAAANDQRQQIIHRVNLVLLLGSSVLFLMWIYRAYDNLYKLHPDKMDCSPGWAVGFWFVPVISLYKPYSIVKEIWEKTQEYVMTEDQKHAIHRAYLVGAWWVLYLISIISSYVVLGMGDQNSIDGLISLTVALMLSNVFLIIVKVITLIMINRIVLFEKELQKHVYTLEMQQPSGTIPGSVNIPGI
ncbi:MAG TPA: DUF4328 domain-containing protein [Bacteroidia bacterium]